jgi:hypothetical protein
MSSDAVHLDHPTKGETVAVALLLPLYFVAGLLIACVVVPVAMVAGFVGELRR